MIKHEPYNDSKAIKVVSTEGEGYMATASSVILTPSPLGNCQIFSVAFFYRILDIFIKNESTHRNLWMYAINKTGVKKAQVIVDFELKYLETYKRFCLEHGYQIRFIQEYINTATSSKMVISLFYIGK